MRNRRGASHHLAVDTPRALSGDRGVILSEHLAASIASEGNILPLIVSDNEDAMASHEDAVIPAKSPVHRHEYGGRKSILHVLYRY